MCRDERTPRKNYSFCGERIALHLSGNFPMYFSMEYFSRNLTDYSAILIEKYQMAKGGMRVVKPGGIRRGFMENRRTDRIARPQ